MAEKNYNNSTEEELYTTDGQPSSELRRDLVTGEWVTIAKGRQHRPKDFVPEDKPEFSKDKSSCPFEDPQASGNKPPVLLYKNKKQEDSSNTKEDETEWSLQVIPNKFPAFSLDGECQNITEEGPYLVRDGYGYHEVLITRDHDKHFALLSTEELTEVVRAYQERFIDLKNSDCVKYISIFHNHGIGAGASLTHPHSQITAIPVIPADVHRSLRGSNLYFRRHSETVHNKMVDFELNQGERVVFESEKFVAFCPYISRAAFELRIYPKEQSPYFEDLPDSHLTELAEALGACLRKLNQTLDNPDYNFFLHTAPSDGRDYSHYHWHIEIIPKTAIWAGFELGTGIEISTIEPKQAAQYLNSEEKA